MVSLHSPLQDGRIACSRPIETGLGSGQEEGSTRLCWPNFLREVAVFSTSRVLRCLCLEAPPDICRFHFTLSLLELVILTLQVRKLRLRELKKKVLVQVELTCVSDSAVMFPGDTPCIMWINLLGSHSLAFPPVIENQGPERPSDCKDRGGKHVAGVHTSPPWPGQRWGVTVETLM